MVIREISRGARKLARIPSLSKKKKKNYSGKELGRVINLHKALSSDISKTYDNDVDISII